MDDMERVAHRDDLVHYISPFGSSAWMPRSRAQPVLEREQHRWLRLDELEMISQAQRSVGAPHIEQAPHK